MNDIPLNMIHSFNFILSFMTKQMGVIRFAFGSLPYILIFLAEPREGSSALYTRARCGPQLRSGPLSGNPSASLSVPYHIF